MRLSAFFWFRGSGYYLQPNEIVPGTTLFPRYGLVPIPTTSTLRSSSVSLYHGRWDYAARLGVDSAVAKWRGPLPCSLVDCYDFLRSSSNPFLLGTRYIYEPGAPILVLGLDANRTNVYAVFSVPPADSTEGSMNATTDITWTQQLIGDGLVSPTSTKAPGVDENMWTTLSYVDLSSLIPSNAELMAVADILQKQYPGVNPSAFIKKAVVEALNDFNLPSRLTSLCPPPKECPPTAACPPTPTCPPALACAPCPLAPPCPPASSALAAVLLTVTVIIMIAIGVTYYLRIRPRR